MNKSEKILLCICFLLSSVIVSYNLFFIPSLPNANVVKKEFVFKESKNDSKNHEGKININLSDENELINIPGVGKSIAERIIEYREQNGGFSSISEIMNVKGIGDAKFNSMKDYICV